jgi:hypothetical protein
MLWSSKYQLYSLWFDPTGARTHNLPHSRRAYLHLQHCLSIVAVYLQIQHCLSVAAVYLHLHYCLSLVAVYIHLQHSLSVAVDCGFEPRSGQTKDYTIGICCFSAKHAALRRMGKDYTYSILLVLLQYIYTYSILLVLLQYIYTYNILLVLLQYENVVGVNILKQY